MYAAGSDPEEREQTEQERGWNEVPEQTGVGWDLILKRRDCP